MECRHLATAALVLISCLAALSYAHGPGYGGSYFVYERRGGYGGYGQRYGSYGGRYGSYGGQKWHKGNIRPSSSSVPRVVNNAGVDTGVGGGIHTGTGDVGVGSDVGVDVAAIEDIILGSGVGGNVGGSVGGGDTRVSVDGSSVGVEDGDCRYYCRTPADEIYCCETTSDPVITPRLKDGVCPKPGILCSPDPQRCSNDGSCPGDYKCCYDTCQQRHTCTPPESI